MTSPQRLYTVEEYLALDAAAPEGVRYEYANGYVTAMSGASGNHEQLVGSLVALIHGAMRGRPCLVYPSSLRVAVRASRAYKYPDVSGLCGRPEFEATSPETLLNPSFLIEVLSRLTEAKDRDSKFAHYKLIPSLSEYVLVSQDRMRVERFLRQGRSWQLDEFVAPDDVLDLPSVECALRLGDLYDRVEFRDGPPRMAPRLVRESNAPAWAAPG